MSLNTEENMSTGLPGKDHDLQSWHQLQEDIARCRDCCQQWPQEVTRPLSRGEIPEPPSLVDILFVGVAPTPEIGLFKGAHFYSSPTDLLRRGLFGLLAEEEFGIPLENLKLAEGNRRFHDAGLFFLHTTKVRPISDAAPPHDAIRFCSLRHLGREIPLLSPRAVCFLGKKNAAAAAHALFGTPVGDSPQSVHLGEWSGVAVVTDQPRRGWVKRTRIALRSLWEDRPLVRSNVIGTTMPRKPNPRHASFNTEFETVDLIVRSSSETRGVDAFALSLIKAERQIRKLFTHLVYQFPAFGPANATDLREALAANRRIYFDGFVRGIDALLPRTLRDIVGGEYERLIQRLGEAIDHRNKIFHGQLTSEYLTREDLLMYVLDIRKWCAELAIAAFGEFQYDGFTRNSLRKSPMPELWTRFKVQLTTIAEYSAFIRRHMQRRHLTPP